MLEGLATLWRSDATRPQVSALLTRLAGQRGARADAGRLRRDIEARARRTTLRIADPEALAPSLRAALGAPDTWPEYPVPAGYQVSGGRISELTLRGETVHACAVSQRPIMPIGRIRDVSTHDESLVLGWRDDETWRTLTLPAAEAFDARLLVRHRGSGLPVSSDSARRVVRWLDVCEACAGAALPRKRHTRRTGWHGTTYVAGPDSVDPTLYDPDGDRSGWVPRGTWAGWAAGLRAIAREPVAWIVLYAALAGVLLRGMGLRHNPILDLSGRRGTGKSTLLALCGSCYGRPDEAHGGTLETWDGTATSIERIAGRAWDAAVLLDDTKRARDPRVVGQLLYELAQGRGRSRGTETGLQRTATWRTVVISTGEAPLVELTEAGGAKVRVLSVDVSPALSSGDTARAIESVIRAHHGHAARRLAAHVGAHKLHLAAAHARWRDAWTSSHDGDARLLSTVAAIDVTADLCIAAGFPAPACDWRTALAQALVGSIDLADVAGRALAEVRS